MLIPVRTACAWDVAREMSNWVSRTTHSTDSVTSLDKRAFSRCTASPLPMSCEFPRP